MQSLLSLIIGLLAVGSSAHGNHGRRASNPALNTQPYNTIPNKGGPRLYYNGSGDVPGYDELSPDPDPITPYKVQALEDNFFGEIQAISQDKAILKSSCQQCVAVQEVLHLAAITLPVKNFVQLYVRYCSISDLTYYSASCHAEFSSTPKHATQYRSGAAGVGAYYAQLYAKMSMRTGDMQAFCYYNLDTCDAPPLVAIDESKYFSPKPKSASVAPEPSGETFNVLHLSDWHIDPRYDIGSEANCTDYFCCRPYSENSDLSTTSQNASLPASRFGYLYCDAPADLALSAFSTMSQFFDRDDNAFVIFTGDIVSHDNNDQLSKAYVEYSERVTYETFKAQMGKVPIYATLGNHDNFPEAFAAPNNVSEGTKAQNAQAPNYELLSSLWKSNDWISGSEAQYASTHYGAYAHTTKQGLRIISFNTDFWYTDNVYNYYDFSNPDTSGNLKWVADELTECEKKGQRAWIIGHVLSGYDGTNALPNPSALFYSIVRRFSPATIAAVFFGHTHTDQLQIFYDYAASSLTNGMRDTTDVDFSKPLMMGFIGPSITPLTAVNAGYQRLQVDAKTFQVMGVQTYFANVSESLTWDTPVWKFEYDTRKTYNVDAISWPKSAPLNASFFDLVTAQMLKNQSLVETYNLLETKSSVLTPTCSTKACARQKVCYIKSGSSALGLACPHNDNFPN